MIATATAGSETAPRLAEPWTAYWADRSDNNRNELVAANVGLVKPAVDGLSGSLPAGVTRAELWSIGNAALIDAVESYTPAINTTFGNWAVVIIRRAMMSHINTVRSRNARQYLPADGDVQAMLARIVDPHAQDPVDVAADRELLAMIPNLLSGLKAEIVVRNLLLGEPMENIAKEHGWPTREAFVLRQRALRDLRAAIERITA